MGAAIGVGLASMGNAFLKSYEDTIERNRRQKQEDEDRAWERENRDAVRSERAKKAKLEQDVADAAAPRVTMSGTVTDAGQGQVFSASPENAAAMQETLAAEAEMRGQTVQQKPGQAVTGAMSNGHQINTGAAPAQADTADAQNQRILDAYRKNGQWEKAMQMENTILEQKSKRMGLETAEYAFLDDKANREMLGRLQTAPAWWDGAAEFITNNQSGPLKGLKAEAVLSKDGKMVEMFAVLKDGKRQSTGAYPANEQGMVMFMDRFAKVPLGTKLAALKDERKRAEEKDEKDRKFKLEEGESASKIRLQNAQADYYGAGTVAREAGAQSVEVKLSEPDKMALTSIGKQKDAINTAIIKAQAEGMFDPTAEGSRALTSQLAALSLKEQQIIARYQNNGATPDPLGMRRPAAAPAAQGGGAVTPNASERMMARQAQGGMGANPQSLRNEIAASRQNLAEVQDENSKKMLADHIAQMELQLARLTSQPAAAPVQGVGMAQAATPAQATAAPVTQAAPMAKVAPTTQQAQAAAPAAAPTMEQIQQQTRENKARLEQQSTQRKQALEKAKSDPDLKTLEAAHKSALRSGNAAQANRYAAAAAELMLKRYGIQ